MANPNQTVRLTAKQEAFCLLIHQGDKQVDAYRKVYSPKAKAPTAYVQSSRILENPKIALRLKELRQASVDKSRYTLEEHLDQLRKISLAAAQNGQFGPCVQAEIARGKAAGFHQEKIQVDHSSRDGTMSPPTQILIRPYHDNGGN